MSSPENQEIGYKMCVGRLAEFLGPGALQAVCGLVLDAQKRREPVAWIRDHDLPFFPPDLEETGVDLEAVTVIRTPDMRGAFFAADTCLRSGAFGLVVMDLYGNVERGRGCGGSGDAVQARLIRLAGKTGAAVVLLSVSGDPGLWSGSLVSLRVSVTRSAGGPGVYEYRFQVVKNKNGKPGTDRREIVRAACGLY
jgi:hypothetical protein